MKTRQPCLSNCNTCDYKSINDDPSIHCYMFRHAPEGVCAQHTGNDNIANINIELFQTGKQLDVDIIEGLCQLLKRKNK